MKDNFSRIPKVYGCIAGCTDCCGPVPFSGEEAGEAFRRTGKHPSCSADLVCCYAVGGRCEIYDIRPMICRVFAASVSPGLQCPRGAWALQPLSRAETVSLLTDSAQKKRMPKGFTMIEVLGALLIMAILMPSLAWLWQKGATEVRKRSVAEHFVTVTHATKKYIRQNYATLRAASSDTAGPVITLATLRADECLSDMVADLNAWNQGYNITTRLTLEGDLAAAIITTGGRGVSAADPAFAQVTVPETAALAKVGFIPVEPNTVIRGPFGSWELTLADLGLAGEPGHLGLLTTLDSQALRQDYLYRVAVPGQPELNAMQTTLDMTDHAIRGVRTLQYSPHSFESLTDFCTAPEDEGSTFMDADKGLYLCRGGQVRVVSDTGNSLAMQGAALATDGQIIDKPVCPAGSATHPEIFVAPSISAAAANAADAEKVKPMHSFQAWAGNYPASDPDAAQWQVRLRVLTSDNNWIYPTPNYGRMMVFTSCVRD